LGEVQKGRDSKFCRVFCPGFGEKSSDVPGFLKYTAKGSEMRALLLDSIQSLEPILKEAEDRDVYAVSMDLFGLRS
jgi:hypothetical protein